MEEKTESEMLEGARLAFSFASQLVYLEPQEEMISSFCETRIFESSPFAAENQVVANGLQLLDGWCVRAAAGDLAAEVKELRCEWLSLFGGAGTPQAPCWESYYVEPNSQLFGRATLDVRSWYRRYGLRIERLHNEPDDNLGLMLGFVGHLMGLESASAASGDVSAAIAAREAQREFMVEHVLPWLPAWRYLAAKYAKSEYYRGIADLVFGLVQEYVMRFGIVFRSEEDVFVAKSDDAAEEADAR